MIFGGCPYCDGLLSYPMPEGGPYWAKDKCEHCGKTFWRWLTRVNPMSFTVEDFNETYEVDEENKKIKVREGKIDIVQKEYDEEGRRWGAIFGGTE